MSAVQLVDGVRGVRNRRLRGTRQKSDQNVHGIQAETFVSANDLPSRPDHSGGRDRRGKSTAQLRTHRNLVRKQ